MNLASIHSNQLLADFEARQAAANASALYRPYPSPHPFGASTAGPFGGLSTEAMTTKPDMTQFSELDQQPKTFPPPPLSDFDYPAGWGAQVDEATGALTQNTPSRVATVQAKLNQRLGSEFLSQRPGPGGGEESPPSLDSKLHPPLMSSSRCGYDSQQDQNSPMSRDGSWLTWPTRCLASTAGQPVSSVLTSTL